MLNVSESLIRKVPESIVDLSVVLPIYNEELSIEATIHELFEVLKISGLSAEVICVDDGSKDKSVEVLRNLAINYPGLKVVVFRRNHGQSAAFTAGFKFSTGNVVATMDADGQNDPRDLPKLIEKLNEGFDLVTGWRYKRKDNFLIRKFPSLIANWMIRKITKTKASDLGCSIKVYKKEILEEIILYGEMHRFLVPLAELVGARVGEIRVNHRARTLGESKYGISRSVKVIFDLLTVWFFKKFHTKPLYIFGSLGGAALFFSFLCLGVASYQKLFLDIWIHKNPLFIMGFFSGCIAVQFFGLGLITEILIRTYFESQDKQHFTVRERIGF
jgi:glycosyltransferase involved in cell wall biosynthesis